MLGYFGLLFIWLCLPFGGLFYCGLRVWWWVLVAGLLLCLRLVHLLLSSWFFRLNWLLLLVVRCWFVFGGLVGGCFVIVTVAGVWVLVYVCGVVCGFVGAVDCGVCGCGILFGAYCGFDLRCFVWFS